MLLNSNNINASTLQNITTLLQNPMDRVQHKTPLPQPIQIQPIQRVAEPISTEPEPKRQKTTESAPVRLPTSVVSPRNAPMGLSNEKTKEFRRIYDSKVNFLGVTPR
jgi:hypothetical protein